MVEIGYKLIKQMTKNIKDKTFKALFVKEPRHNDVAVRAKKNRMTIDDYIAYLLTLDKQNNE